LRSEINPVVAVIVIVVLVVVVGGILWSRSGGRTFTKDEVRGGGSAGIGGMMKMGK
jgi:ABC-type transporter Mla subunit MlaD